ncbi:MAG TPA: FAD:protein FMN transferase [Clostridiaceae bacterium]|nr:FAD:protein FMN transferase [Clostridiaceae bacterium]
MESQKLKFNIIIFLLLNLILLIGCDSKHTDNSKTTLPEDEILEQSEPTIYERKSSDNTEKQESSVNTEKQESSVNIEEQDNKLIGSDFLLNTYCTITLYNENDKDLIYDAFAICRDYENQLSCKISSSEISQLNNRIISQVSDSTVEVLETALLYSELSEGALDITIGSVTDLWDFTSGSEIVPSPDSIQKALISVNYKNLQLNNNQVIFSNDETRIDLGAIAKGYIADQMKAYLTEQGVESAIINLGGNVLCLGTKEDNIGFTVGIQKPFAEGYVAGVHLDDFYQSVVTSGIYERFFEKDGIFYHHILDPKTGMPIDNSLTSVTIISEESVDGDALSTACFVLGLEKGMELIDSLDNVHAIFLDEEENLYFSENLLEELQIDIL